MLLQTNPRMDIYLDGAYIGNTLIRKGDEDGTEESCPNLRLELIKIMDY